MPTTKVYWNPPTNPAITQYQVTRADSLQANFFLLQLVSAAQSGPNWDATTSRYFIEDPDGRSNTAYRVQGFADGGYLASDSGPFVPSAGRGSDLLTKTRVDHNYGGTDALRYVISTGVNVGRGVSDATIRIFRADNFNAGMTTAPLFAVQTDENGRWATPVFLDNGWDYVLTFEKAGAFGVDKTTITL